MNDVYLQYSWFLQMQFYFYLLLLMIVENEICVLVAQICQ